LWREVTAVSARATRRVKSRLGGRIPGSARGRNMSETVCVKTYGSRGEAELARNVLESAGIRAMVLADDIGGVGPQLGFASGGVKLMVLSENLERATALLRSSDAG